MLPLQNESRQKKVMLLGAEQRRRIVRRGQHMVEGRVWFTSSSASDSISWFPRCIAETGGSNIMESRRGGEEERNIRV